MAKIKEFFKVYLQSFYSPSLYRDVVFRGEGYGLKPIFKVFIFLMLPSYVMMSICLGQLYMYKWPKDIQSLPVLNIQKSGLTQINQAIGILPNPKLFTWLPSDNIMDDAQNPHKTDYYLGSKFLWAKMPSSHFFGFSFFQNEFYLPIINWAQVKSPAYGPNIYQAMSKSYLLMMAMMFYAAIAMMGIFYIFLFVRSFAIIARRMVTFVLNESMDYLPACRLLSVSAIPALTSAVLICDLGWYQDMFKYVFIFIYMFYFYLGVRFIRSKSVFKWMMD